MTAPAPDLFSGRGAVAVAALYVATDGCYFGMPDVASRSLARLAAFRAERPAGGWRMGRGRLARRLDVPGRTRGHYGHRARKPTWLYAVRVALPSLRWGPSQAAAEWAQTSSRRKKERSKGDAVELMTHEERAATPAEFRDLLLSMARSARSDNRHSVDEGGNEK